MSRPLPSFGIESLRFDGVRNLGTATLQPAPGLNLVHGDNGHGKTSLLEAIYVLCTTKSFRTARLREVAAHGKPVFVVRGRTVERRGDLPELAREQSVAFDGKAALAMFDGKKPRSLAEYAVRAPVVVFHPEELALSTGPAALRRRLLDRVALYRAPVHAEHTGRYAKALRSRQELLRRGSRGGSELEAYETVLAEAGAVLTRSRREATERLREPVMEAFRETAAPDLRLGFDYRAGGDEDVTTIQRELLERRDSDARSPAATFGPHRDDLVLTLGGRSIRKVASQGQHRIATLALKAGESETIARITGLEPIQLLDDVSSELDPTRTEALLDLLARARGQVFVTTPRAALLKDPWGQRKPKEFQVINGEFSEA